MKRPSRRRHSWVLVSFGLLLIHTHPAPAHDSFLVASRNSAAEPCTVRVSLRTAEGFPASEYQTKPARVDEWIVISGRTRKPVSGYTIQGLELAADLALEEPGLHVIATSLHPRFIEFGADHFNRYLRDEHAGQVIALRKGRGQTDQPGRMCYTKLVKTFVEVGAQPTEDYKQPAGHTLEIIPLSNPCRWRVGDQVVVRVLYEGRPAAGMRVSSGHEGLAPHAFVEDVFTDSEGQARFRLTRPGLWFLRTHLIRSVGPAKARRAHALPADWESFWASITFRVGG